MSTGTEILTFCHENEVEYLKEALLLGVDPDVRDLRGRSGLHISAMRGGDEVLRALLQAGAEANIVDAQGNTPLHVCGHRDTVHSLVEFGACVNASLRRGGATFLYMSGASIQEVMVCGDWSSETVYRYLTAPISHRVMQDLKISELLNSIARNAHGDTPLILMSRRGVSPDVIEVMEQYINEEPMETRSEHPIYHQPTPHRAVKLRTTAHVKNIWDEFCNDLGLERLAIVLVLVLCLSLYVAYTITGYAQMMDSRIPVQFESQRVEL